MKSNKPKLKTKKSASRRKILKAGLIGGTVTASQTPAKWTKPVVNSVLLPAHAVATGGGGDGGEGNVTTYFRDITDIILTDVIDSNTEVIAESAEKSDGKIVGRMADLLLGTATAADIIAEPRRLTATMCVAHDNGSVDITYTVVRTGFSTTVYTGSGALNAPVLISAPICPKVKTIIFQVTASNPTDMAIDVQFTGSKKPAAGVFSVPAGNCISQQQVCPPLPTTEAPTTAPPP